MRTAWLRHGVLAAGALALLGGCVTPGGGLPGSAAGDGCGREVSGFGSAADPLLRPAGSAAAVIPFHAHRAGLNTDRPEAPQPPVVVAAPAPLDRQLAAENADLDRVQIAFDALLYCRWIEGRTIRADLAAGRLGRAEAEARMAAVRERLRRDLDAARRLIESLGARATAREAELERSAPGLRTELARAAASRGTPVRALAAATVPLRLRPEAAAPEVGRVPAGRTVSLRPAAGGFARIEEPGLRGYAPVAAFQVVGRPVPAAPAAGTGLRQLAAANIARRDNFAESVRIAEAAAAEGFELAS
ncbi:MAG: hypothetical protein ACK4PG_01040 [Acetobacteraceae bacterium]